MENIVSILVFQKEYSLYKIDIKLGSKKENMILKNHITKFEKQKKIKTRLIWPAH